MNVSQPVEPDRVHRQVYTDRQIFDRAMTKIFEHVWVYCGHDSQVRRPVSVLTCRPVSVLTSNRGILNWPQVEIREEPIADLPLVVRDR